MKRYERYKESGASWIGKLPEHWKTKKIKYVFTERSEKGFPKEPVLCSTQKYGVIPQSLYENRVVVVNKGLENLKRVRKGDFVISLRSFQGGIEYAYYQGIISAAYTILQLTDSANSDYIKFLFKSLDFIQLLKTCVTGIREGQNINYDLLRKNSIPLPPLNEQAIIVSYLDKKISEIDSYVEKRKKLIASLSELKKSIIANAVTKGLNPNPLMKDSGIPWIGMIPEYWEKCRNKDVLKEIKTLVGDDSSKYTLLSLTTKGVIIRDVSEGKGKFPKDFNSYKIVKPNNLVFCLFDVDETPRTVGIVQNEGMLTGAYNVFQTRKVVVKFLYYYFISMDDRKALKPLYKGLRKVIPLPTFMSMPIYLPKFEEQQAIVDYLDSKIKQIEAYKKSLLSEIDYIRHIQS